MAMSGNRAKLVGTLKRVASSAFGKHFLLAFVLVAMVAAGMATLMVQGDARARRWLSEDLDDLTTEVTLGFGAAFEDADADQEARLQAQYEVVRSRALLHLKVMTYFYSRQYMAVTMATILGLTAGLALIFISKTGWAKANTYLLTVFVVTAVSAAFFAAFPALFQQQKNIDDNRDLYIAYTALEQRLVSYAATAQDASGEDVPLSDYIHRVDKDLAALHNLPLHLDPEAVPEPPSMTDQ